MENSNTELTKKFCPLRKGGFTVEEISKSYYGNLYRAAAALKFDQILALEDKNSNADVSKMLAKDEESDGRPCMIKGRTKTFSKTFALVYRGSNPHNWDLGNSFRTPI